MREARAKASGQDPVLTLDVVDDGRAGPRQQGRDDQAHALARAGRRKGHDMLRAVMAQVTLAQHAEHDTGIAMEAGALDLAGIGPARRAIGGDLARLARAPQGAEDRRAAANETAGAGEHPCLVENARGIGIVMVPPAKQRPGAVDRQVVQPKPRHAQLGLIGQHRRRPLGRRPDPGNDDAEDNKDLADEQFGGGHRQGSRPPAWAGAGGVKLGERPQKRNCAGARNGVRCG